MHHRALGILHLLNSVGAAISYLTTSAWASSTRNCTPARLRHPLRERRVTRLFARELAHHAVPTDDRGPRGVAGDPRRPGVGADRHGSDRPVRGRATPAATTRRRSRLRRLSAFAARARSAEAALGHVSAPSGSPAWCVTQRERGANAGGCEGRNPCPSGWPFPFAVGYGRCTSNRVDAAHPIHSVAR